MTADLSALIARLEAAEVGSRELGHDVLLSLGWHRDQIGNFYGPLYQWSSPDRSPHFISGDEDKLPNPAISLDAALALAERVLPGFTWRVQRHTSGMFDAALWADPDDNYVGYGRTPSPALSLCIAILKAKAQGESNG
ncbi:hypothetical protein [Brevundimonas pondensis]|jgi:hypothetical protein|uniref:Phage ABA sandwich domain-containing protein n=1 Tax=Brevundimonas pondensis TaxID=2774189 RepID=A0ABX7SM91_9CAUL|nr:hypothetical protein [Brevundimonas pondensis]QTC87920.1 hypothetical protein IFE19_00455 [Brevundimonas pondensis]